MFSYPDFHDAEQEIPIFPDKIFFTEKIPNFSIR